MPHRHRVVVTEVHATIVGEELLDLDLVGVLGLELFGADLDLLRGAGVDLIFHARFVIQLFNIQFHIK